MSAHTSCAIDSSAHLYWSRMHYIACKSMQLVNYDATHSISLDMTSQLWRRLRIRRRGGRVPMCPLTPSGCMIPGRVRRSKVRPWQLMIPVCLCGLWAGGKVMKVWSGCGCEVVVLLHPHRKWGKLLCGRCGRTAVKELHAFWPVEAVWFLFVGFWWPVNTWLEMGFLEAQDDAIVGMVRPLPSGHLRILNEHFRL